LDDRHPSQQGHRKMGKLFGEAIIPLL